MAGKLSSIGYFCKQNECTEVTFNSILEKPVISSIVNEYLLSLHLLIVYDMALVSPYVVG